MAGPALGQAAPVDARCRICGDVGPHEGIRLREMMFATRETFEYLRCRACRVLQIIDVPADLERHYPPRYYSLGGSSPGADPLPAPTFLLRERLRPFLAGGRRGWRRIFEFVDRRIELPADFETVALPLITRAGLRSFRDRILDVGCGARPGRLAALRHAGFTRVLGIEPYIEGDFVFDGVPVRRTTVDALTGRFALVMLHHSFEHVPEPVQTLAATARLVRPGGSLLIRTPLMGSGMWDRYGRDWVELDAPRHLFVFPAGALVDLAGQHGFRLVDVEFDADHWDLIASEQYRVDVGMFDPTSWFVDPGASRFNDGDIAEFRHQSRMMNAQGTAGRAAFWFRRS